MIKIYSENDKSSSPSGWKFTSSRKTLVLGIVMISLIALAPLGQAGSSCCSVGNWEATAQAFLSDEDAGGQVTGNDNAQSKSNNAGISDSAVTDSVIANSGIADSGIANSKTANSSAANSSIENSSAAAKEPAQRSDAFQNGEALLPLRSVSSSYLVLDISNDNSYTASHIKGAVHLPWQNLLVANSANGGDSANGILKTERELAEVLGEAGVSQNNSVVLYGSPESSGETQLVFWILNYLGQAEVKVLDGNLEDWKAAGLPVESSENKRPAVEYKPAVKSDLLADYDYVKSSQAQILDVRPFADLSRGRIPGSVALDPSNLIKGDRIKDADGLNAVFERLDKDKPVVVYSDDYSRSALVWYALKLMGFNASIYTWVDWKAHDVADAQIGTAPTGGDAVGSKYTKLGTT